MKIYFPFRQEGGDPENSRFFEMFKKRFSDVSVESVGQLNYIFAVVLDITSYELIVYQKFIYCFYRELDKDKIKYVNW